MSSTTPTPTKTSFVAKTRKAFAGGFAGAATGLGAGLTALATAGKLDPADLSGDIWTVAGFTLGGFAVGFAAVWRTPNAA